MTPTQRARQCLDDWERDRFCLWDARAYTDLIRDLMAERNLIFVQGKAGPILIDNPEGEK